MRFLVCICSSCNDWCCTGFVWHTSWLWFFLCSTLSFKDKMSFLHSIPLPTKQTDETKARKHTNNNIVRYFVRMPLHHFTTYAAVVQSTSYNFLDTAPASQFLFRPKSKKRASIGTRGCGRQNICPVLRPVVFSSNGFQVMVRERV